VQLIDAKGQIVSPMFTATCQLIDITLASFWQLVDMYEQYKACMSGRMFRPVNNDKLYTIKRLMMSHLGSKAMLTQIDRIVLKFGGVKPLQAALKNAGYDVTDITIRRWNYPKKRYGRDGSVPKAPLDAIVRAARLEGIILTPEDLDPRPIPASGKYVPNFEEAQEADENEF